MVILSLFWVIVGILIGSLANAARLRSTRWGRYGWLGMPSVGVLAAVLGGWLGALLLGRDVATAMALWIAVLGVVLVWCLGIWIPIRQQALEQRNETTA
jgi:uncharacterized membrane protein YeaQ/YmgE (transglycosylase-associated protein family)